MTARVNFPYAKERKKERKKFEKCVLVSRKRGEFGSGTRADYCGGIKNGGARYVPITILPFGREGTSSEHASRVSEDEASRDRD